MSEKETTATDAESEQVASVPSPRAKALREEIFGAALTLDEASYILSLDRTTVAKYLRENVLFGFQIGREWLIPEEELRAYVKHVADQRRSEAGQSTEGRPSSNREQPTLLERVRRDFPFGGGRRPKFEPFERFTERARKVVALAQEEARRFNHAFIGTEHLLLGLTSSSDNGASRVLANLGVERERLRQAVEGRLTRGEAPVTAVGLTARAKKALHLADEESLRLRHDVVDTEHLLLGLVREGKGVAGAVLEHFDVSLETARRETLRLFETQTRRAGSGPYAGLSEIALGVTDVHTAAAFYSDVVGLTLENAGELGASFWSGEPGHSPRLLLTSRAQRPLPERDVPEGEQRPLLSKSGPLATFQPGQIGPSHFALLVAEEKLAEAVAHVRERGVDVDGPVCFDWMKATSYYFLDLDGNLVEFWSPIK